MGAAPTSKGGGRPFPDPPLADGSGPGGAWGASSAALGGDFHPGLEQDL